MVPTTRVVTGIITNILFDWTAEVTNFKLDFQTVGQSSFIAKTNLSAIKAAIFLITICSLPVVQAMPPNIQADYDIVPGMKILWDGIPINDFLEEFMRPLDMGLGQVVQDGFSLLSCIRGSDSAGYDPITANPHYGNSE